MPDNTKNTKKVLVAMSGGVDSSVAAAMLLEAGYQVTGVFMCLGSAGSPDRRSQGCCSPQDAADARRVAQKLGIDLFVLDLSADFEPIIEHFARQYASGRTPNPCILCNSRIKFGRLLERADSLGIGWIATGHHARMGSVDGTPAIRRARAREKDQSYALFDIARETLGRIILPIGKLDDKAGVRRIARQLGLNVHDKPDSQEICFVPDDDYVSLLRARAPGALRGGNIVDTDGNVLGTHDGYARFTVGQRRGLGVAAGVPMYVTRIDPATAQVTIGTRRQASSRRLSASGANWHIEPDEELFEATVQIRYNHPGAPATVRLTGPDTFIAEFREPVHAIAPGQAATVYRNEYLMGGGWID